MINTQTTLIALLSAVALTACGGGGSDESNNSPAALQSAQISSDGLSINLNFAAGAISETLPAPTSVTVTANGVAIPVASLKANGTGVDVVLTKAVQSGQTIRASYTAPAFDPSPTNAAIQNKEGVDAAGFSDVTVSNTVAGLPSVLLNGAAATANGAGEYVVTAPTRVTVEDSRLGFSSSQTVNASGANATTSMSVHSISSSKYDVTFTIAPVGGLTTIKLGGTADNPLLVIKLRWQ